jgi:hypothetical protein
MQAMAKEPVGTSGEFSFAVLVPDLTAITQARYSEEADRPDIKAWPNPRAADVVRRGIAAANAVLALRAGAKVTWNGATIPSDIRHGAEGVILGFRGRQVLVSFPPVARHPSVYELNRNVAPSAPWQGFVDPGALLPAKKA